MRRFFLLILVLCIGIQVIAQISQGGKPIEFPRLKKLTGKVLVDLPYLNNDRLLKSSLTDFSENKLKSLTFAESIPVCLNTSNSGEWIEYNRHRIWTLEIRSEGAKSINLIFDEYELPPGGRLFIYSPDKKHQIGAFTADNNKSTGILATEPIYGDHIILQYEEPLKSGFNAKLSVGEVNHDFIGIVAPNVERRPRGLSGACNVNVNCDYVENYQDQASGVVRLVIAGSELCTGTLLNNTAKDGKPYIYGAAHCIQNAAEAAQTVFLFNYESPYCGEIDGDASRSVSGSTLRARFDSLDFSLLEMSVPPPPSYHPYYLGWDRSTILPDSSASIHHAQGDIKKIALDFHSPKIKSYASSNDYIANAFYLVAKWEKGTTELGSSGAGLLNQDGHFVGSLTGGSANCGNPRNDYFSMFRMAWDYSDDPAKSLKSWLDPEGSDLQVLGGMPLYEGKDFCGAFTNFTDEDTHENLEIIEGGQSKGNWAGVNNYGYTNFAEKFVRDSGSEVAGVSVGFADIAKNSASSGSVVKIQVYNGSTFPEKLVYEQVHNVIDIDPGVMNYFKFPGGVTVEKNFFVGVSIDQLDSEDSVSVYLAKREVNPVNSFFIKDGNEWYSFQDKNGETQGSALLMEVVLCGIDINLKDSDIVANEPAVEAFPNPISSTNPRLYLHFKDEISPERISIYDFSGHLVYEQTSEMTSTNWLNLDLTGFKTGTYIVRVITDRKSYQSKVLFIDN